MSSSTYTGPATLISGLDEIPVTADLQIEAEPFGDGALYSWRGELASEDDRLVAAIGSRPILRLPDGATGHLYVRGGEQEEAGPVVAEIIGDGPAPWAEGDQKAP